jgi:O-antigen/teichoic acid export membrane protein
MPIPKLSTLNNKHVLALVGNIVIAGFGILVIAVLSRYMAEPQDLGIWFFFFYIYNLADAVRNGLLTTATVKFYAGAAPERANAVLGSVWFLAILLTAGMVLINLAALPFLPNIHNQEIEVLIQWFGLTVISSLTYNITFWILVADENYTRILWLRLLNSGSTVLSFAVLAFLHKATLFNVLLANFSTNCLTSIVCIVMGYSKVNMLFKRTKAVTAELFNFGKFSLSSTISSYLLGAANGLIVNGLLGPTALAVFTIPNRLMEIVEIPLRSFVGTGMSAMATAYNTNNMYHLTFVSKKYAGMLTLVFIPLAIITFFGADLGIWVLGGSHYLSTAAPNILRMMMFIAVLYPIDRFNGVTLDIINQPKINVYKVILMGVVNISVAFISILLLKNIYGVVAATFCTTVAGIIFGYHHLRKHLNYTIRDILSLGFIELKNFYYEKVLKRPPATNDHP